MEAAKSLAVEWTYRTVIHRDLYEEQVMLDALVGLIDLDDAAAGPPELDLGNLLAHLDFRYPADGWRTPQKLEAALLEGYEAGGGSLNPYLLNRCRRLTLLRLACIHGVDALVERAAENVERLNS
jgi:Ser/Thr protein kinase RdoA (MazF antagonist)